MALLAGTRSGVYRVDVDAVEAADRTLDATDVMRVRAFETGTYAATRSGLYRSRDAGRTWTHLETPHEEVYSVLEVDAGGRLYAGTHPAHLYVSPDDGASWRECVGLQALPSRDQWHTPRHRDEAHVRALQSAGSDRLVAGIEVGGVHRSDDAGETWRECRQGLHDDVHHVLVDGGTWYAATGDGLYRTRDSGDGWTRLDGDLEHRYFREAHRQDGRLYAAATRGPPPAWSGPDSTDATLVESTDDGDTLEAVPYDGGPGEFVLSFASEPGDGPAYAGTTAGTILRRTETRWTSLGTVAEHVTSLALVDGTTAG